MGQVRTPGKYPLQGDNSLLEVLAMAGSLANDAGTEIVVLRPRSEEGRTAATLPDDANATNATVMRIDLQAIEQGRMSGNIQLQDGDTVFVPEGGKVLHLGPRAIAGCVSVRERHDHSAGDCGRRRSHRSGIDRAASRCGARSNGVIKDVSVSMNSVVLPNDTIIDSPAAHLAPLSASFPHVCAIAGVISRAPLDEAPALAARLDAHLAHRGP